MDLWIAYTLLIAFHTIIAFSDDNTDLRIYWSSLAIVGIWVTGVIS
jgi:hypothetical protein